jgi:predicted ribosome quality control (RQC) complex YloA/Tae2 family protein
MDFQLLSQVVNELAALITGARVERVYQGSDDALVFILGRDRMKFILLISPDRSLPRLHLVTAKPPAGDSPHSFGLYLRSRLPGTRVKHIMLMNQDRIVEIRFSGLDGEYCLVSELFGHAANLIFSDSSSTILSVYYPVPPADRVSRPLIPGLTYRPPERKPHGAGNPEEVISTASGGGRAHNQAAEQYFDRLMEQRRAQSLRSELRGVMRRAHSKTERLRDALTRDLLSAERAEDYRLFGDLVLANLNCLRTGMERVELTGYDGKTIAVFLDPKLSPARNAELYFKKYKKAKAGRDIIVTRLKQVDDDAVFLRSHLLRVEEAESIDALIGIRSELSTRGYLRKRTGERSGSHPEPPGPPIKKVVYREWEILIGRNAAGNDYLTMRLARPDDLWLHAEGLPGSHVLIRNPRNADIPPDVLLKAAGLAAFYSKGKASAKVSVTYTRAALVKKPKGAKPGLVMLSERRSVMVKPEDA